MTQKNFKWRVTWKYQTCAVWNNGTGISQHWYDERGFSTCLLINVFFFPRKFNNVCQSNASLIIFMLTFLLEHCPRVYSGFFFVLLKYSAILNSYFALDWNNFQCVEKHLHLKGRVGEGVGSWGVSQIWLLCSYMCACMYFRHGKEKSGWDFLVHVFKCYYMPAQSLTQGQVPCMHECKPT